MLERRGYAVVDLRRPQSDMFLEPRFVEVYRRCRPFTLTSPERLYALYKAVEYVVKEDVEGAVVECGVWKGGSAMLSALALDRLGDTSRRVYLYDTFEGMAAPTELDGDAARAAWAANEREGWNALCYAPLDEVRANVLGTGLAEERFVFVKGRVEDTIPDTAPDRIAVLRLDTDWYESTHHELLHLFPRLSPRGVVIVDDYGHWQGAREAVDRYFEETGQFVLLSRIDETARLGIKA